MNGYPRFGWVDILRFQQLRQAAEQTVPPLQNPLCQNSQYRAYQTYAKFISANLALFPKPYKNPRKNLPFHPQNDIFRQGTRRHHHLILSHTTPPQPITHIVVCFLALYHNLNILKSRCKGAKLSLCTQDGFHRMLT